jgi:hypothetical protein
MEVTLQMDRAIPSSVTFVLPNTFAGFEHLRRLLEAVKNAARHTADSEYSLFDLSGVRLAEIIPDNPDIKRAGCSRWYERSLTTTR